MAFEVLHLITRDFSLAYETFEGWENTVFNIHKKTENLYLTNNYLHNLMLSQFFIQLDLISLFKSSYYLKIFWLDFFR